jgi:hypothetical protein
MKNRTDKFCKAQSAILVEKFTFVKQLGRGHGACVNARNPMENGSQQKVAHKKRQVAARCPCQALCLIIVDAYSSHRAACHAQSRVTSQRRVPCACEPLNPRRLPPSKCTRVGFQCWTIICKRVAKQLSGCLAASQASALHDHVRTVLYGGALISCVLWFYFFVVRGKPLDRSNLALSARLARAARKCVHSRPCSAFSLSSFLPQVDMVRNAST